MSPYLSEQQQLQNYLEWRDRQWQEYKKSNLLKTLLYPKQTREEFNKSLAIKTLTDKKLLTEEKPE